MAEVPFRPARQPSEYKGKGASASRELNPKTTKQRRENTQLGCHIIRLIQDDHSRKYFAGIQGRSYLYARTLVRT